METLHYEFPASPPAQQRVQVGVVASGDLEVLLEPSSHPHTRINIMTSVTGRKALWDAVMQRIFADSSRPAVQIEINDCGATPGVVRLRLEQALELAHTS